MRGSAGFPGYLTLSCLFLLVLAVFSCAAVSEEALVSTADWESPVFTEDALQADPWLRVV